MRVPTAFDPTVGTIIRSPVGSGYGYWIGGHKVSYHDGRFVLFYRVRTPLEHGRGGLCRVAVSDDGVTFRDVWEATSAEFAASSIEVGHAVKVGDEWRLYVSYEVAGTSTWRIDVVRAGDPGDFVAQTRRTVLEPGDYDLAWIKDPFVVFDGGRLLLVAAAPDRTGVRRSGGRVEARPRDASVIAESDDGLVFGAIEYVFEAPGGDGWDGRRARLNGMVPYGDGWLATYDGGRTFYDNYEEWCGVAVGPDPYHLERIPLEAPWVVSPHGCVRYVTMLTVEDRWYWYYEYTRADGSHDLRVSVTGAP